MKKSALVVLLTFIFSGLMAQYLPIEIMAGNKYLFHQNNIQKRFARDPRFGFSQIMSFNLRTTFDEGLQKDASEVMNQVYATYEIGKGFSGMAGTFYTNATGFRPSLSFQFLLAKNGLFLLLKPRMDIAEKGAFEWFGILEYSPKVSEKRKLYTRFQSMNNWGLAAHNRSYHHFRLGLHSGKLQFGLAYNIEVYGESRRVEGNSGVFIRTVLL